MDFDSIIASLEEKPLPVEIPKSRQAAEEKAMQSAIKAIDYATNLSKADKYALFETGLFNDIVRGYVSVAADRIGIENTERLLDVLNACMIEISAEEALNAYKEREDARVLHD